MKRTWVRPLALAIVIASLSGAPPASALCRDCLFGTHCVGLADGFGFQVCIQRVSCKQQCIRYEGDSCEQWIEFGCVDISCRVQNPCSGFPY